MTEPNAAMNGSEGVSPDAGASSADNGLSQDQQYEARLRSDPEFAVEQVKKFRSENTKLFQKNRSMSPLEKIVEQAGGAEKAAGWIHEYDAVLKDPRVAKSVEHYRRTGTLPIDQSSAETFNDDGGYVSPEQKRIDELEAKLNAVANQVSNTQFAVGKQALTSMLGQIKSEMPDGFDDYIAPYLQAKFEEFERNPEGRVLLSNLNIEQLRAIAGRAVYDNLKPIAEKTQRRQLEALGRRSTGEPSGNLTTGRESAAKTDGRVSSSQVLKEFLATGAKWGS